jgi:flagellar basal-body rod protein FlgF
MENILTIALTRQMAMEEKMDVLSNNLANASTAGFKGEQILFVEYLSEPDEGGTISLVQDLSVIRNYGQGPLLRTSNPLDLAVQGEGWFMVESPQGRFYTRDGNFRLNDLGQLVNASGAAVLNQSGEPIVFSPDETDFKISGDGTVSTSAGQKSRIGVVTFADQNLMEKMGGNLYSTSQTPEPALEASVVQGMIEQANIQPIIEVTNMIEALRAYQAAQKLIEAELALQDETIATLTDTSST